jgi:hypothetical protein
MTFSENKEISTEKLPEDNSFINKPLPRSRKQSLINNNLNHSY